MASKKPKSARSTAAAESVSKKWVPAPRAPKLVSEKKLGVSPVRSLKLAQKTAWVVGIGASAGGLEALEQLFAHMPATTGGSFVVISHQHAGQPSMLPALLRKVTKLEVLEATQGLTLQPDCIYLSPPGRFLSLRDGALHLKTSLARKAGSQFPIDYFFQSVAKEQKDRAVVIVLSGTGTDGILGLKAVKAEGGRVLVQDEPSAKYPGMPGSAIAAGLVDCVLAPAEMPSQTIAFANGSMSEAQMLEVATLPQAMQKIFGLLRTRTGNDFSSYKSTTIRRRIERRIHVHQLKGPGQYVAFLQANPHEIDILFKELLISVTNFFRDPDAFAVLVKQSLPSLIKTRPDNYSFRAWVPGCASGEEVFSLAIVLRELMETQRHHFDVQIFGTDLDAAAIEMARAGQFPANISRDVSLERLKRYFVPNENAYRIRKDIREMAIFAVQNVIKDPPFTKLDLISCRNLLIYLSADLQRRLLPIFHYALKPGGLLFLGSSETVGAFTDLFEVVDKKWKIFRRKESAMASHPLMDFPAQPVKSDAEIQSPTPGRLAKEASFTAVMDRLLLTRFCPACVVVSARGDVIYIHGSTGAYLEPAIGRPRLNILDMAREGLRLELASALRHAVAQDSDVTREALRIPINGEYTFINITVSKIEAPESLNGLLLVTFRPRPAPVESPVPKLQIRGRRESNRVEVLERELQCTKESLQATIEELQTSNEEFKSTNEELQSTNEELQSANEEMETSKEEMQSLNEELTTVNAEMETKVEELSRTNDDMQNLLNSTGVATIFLDKQLNIKRFAEQARRLIKLIKSDIGRPLEDLVSSLKYPHLVADCAEVLRTLVPKVAEVQTRDGRWYLMRVMPYRTAENIIDGVVATFVDINPVKVLGDSA